LTPLLKTKLGDSPTQMKDIRGKQELASGLYEVEVMQDKGIITETLLAKHTRKIAQLKPDPVSKMTEKVVFCR
jgi:hypothetical protein